MEKLVVVGGGFAGLWAAASAARARSAFGARFQIALISPDPFHTIRVRCYEADLAMMRVLLDDILAPIEVERIEARVTAIDPVRRTLEMSSAQGSAETSSYDRLILAPGSALTLPAMPITGPTFDVDSYAGAARLDDHLRKLAAREATMATRTIVVIGGGLVGVELACEMPGRLRALFNDGQPVRVLLIDRGTIGKYMGEGADAVDEALARLGVEGLSGTSLFSVEPEGVTLGDGTFIPAATVVFATGMKASPLVATLGIPCDRLGRLPVDKLLQVEGVDDIYAAGDCANAAADESGHRTVMSCQHARPMGRLAGHNAACDLIGHRDERLAFSAPDYVTVLDLGPTGALYTEGWERGRLVAAGSDAKTIKQTINGIRIYPPTPPDRDAILAAATPVIQNRP
ncbi:NAD(P)/FAD-dependent oxidoreductase [Xanthobacteraceae bacterium A53D]